MVGMGGGRGGGVWLVGAGAGLCDRRVGLCGRVRGGGRGRGGRTARVCMRGPSVGCVRGRTVAVGLFGRTVRGWRGGERACTDWVKPAAGEIGS